MIEKEGVIKIREVISCILLKSNYCFIVNEYLPCDFKIEKTPSIDEEA